MNSFTLPAKSQIHLCLNQREARALSDLIELHLLRSDLDSRDELAERELSRQLDFRLDDLQHIATGIVQEMRNCGWFIS